MWMLIGWAVLALFLGWLLKAAGSHMEGRQLSGMRLGQMLLAVSGAVCVYMAAGHFMADAGVGFGFCLVYGWLFFFIASLGARVKESAVGPLASLAGPVCSLLGRLSPYVDDGKDSVSEEQIRQLLASVSQESIDEPQKELLENVFELDDTSLDEICTHRSDVVWLELDGTAGEWEKIIHDNRHTYYPILAPDNEEVVGILDTRDYFRMEDRSIPACMHGAIEPPLFAAETMKADDLFQMMQARKTYFAVVLDEYGGMTGIVTLHDVMETLLGDMPDADQKEEPVQIRRLADGSFEASGLCGLDAAAEMIGVDLPVDEYDTLGGFVLGTYGFIPADGMQLEVEAGPLAVKIFDIQRHRIVRMNVRKKDSRPKNEKGKE